MLFKKQDKFDKTREQIESTNARIDTLWRYIEGYKTIDEKFNTDIELRKEQHEHSMHRYDYVANASLNIHQQIADEVKKQTELFEKIFKLMETSK